jgi:hypothetical protein
MASWITDGPQNGRYGTGPRALRGPDAKEGVHGAPLLKRAGAECQISTKHHQAKQSKWHHGGGDGGDDTSWTLN